MAHAERRKRWRARRSSPRRRSLAGLDRSRPRIAGGDPGGDPGGRRDRDPVCRRGRALRLHRPLIWSDELASILFLWLAMLGAVVAFRRGEHMRMTALVASARPGDAGLSRRRRDLCGAGVPAADVWPAYDYAYEESFITTPALQISNTWRAAALPVGICLMALFALLRLARAATSGSCWRRCCPSSP